MKRAYEFHVANDHGDVWSSFEIEAGACPMCGAHAIVPLTPRLLAIQPDGTTHVCHPGFGGCNHGFARDAGEVRS